MNAKPMPVDPSATTDKPNPRHAGRARCEEIGTSPAAAGCAVCGNVPVRNPGDSAASVHHGRAAATGHPSVGNGDNPTSCVALCARILAFAATAGIADFVRFHPAAPAGYYLELLSAAAFPDQQLAWCLLAGIAGQLDDPAPTLPLDPAFFAWLTDGENTTATAVWGLLAATRRARGAPSPPATPGAAPPQWDG